MPGLTAERPVIPRRIGVSARSVVAEGGMELDCSDDVGVGGSLVAGGAVVAGGEESLDGCGSVVGGGDVV